jgi:hypothetical protein
MHKEFRVNRSTQVVLRGVVGMVAFGLALGAAIPATARVLDADMQAIADSSAAAANAAPGSLRHGGHGPLSPQAVPEINGPGRVSTVGNVWLKTTNIGVMGNPFTANSSDPSAQWPGPSGNEFLFYWGLWVGAKNPEAQDPTQVRRVSSNTEWRPPTLAPEDHIYQAYDGQVNGTRDVDDDQDGRVDEEFLNGKDDDNDGAIDEDYAAISQQMFTCELRDDTEQAVNANFAEKHVPFGLLVRQTTYAFAVPGANDFTAVNYDVYNQSGHSLDSVFVGFLVDQDVGPTSLDRYFADDLPEPRVPQGDYPVALDPSVDHQYNALLCPIDSLHVRGFSMTDDDGDLGRTNAASSFLLLGMTTDPTGVKGPRRVGFRMYRAYLPGTPYVQGGGPTVDLERFQTLAFGLNGATAPIGIDPATGLINEERPEESTKTDYFSICSVGPYLDWQNGEKISVQVGLAIQRCDYTKNPNNPASADQPNPERYGLMQANAQEAQKTFNGKYQAPTTSLIPTPDAAGRETGLIAPPGGSYQAADCHDEDGGETRTVEDDHYTWFDFDCNYCTGVAGEVLKHWLAAAPPPSPGIRLTPGDRKVTIEWDNLSEVSPDPSTGDLDFKAYRIWKASNYTRPVGASGPSEELWALLAELKLYDYLTPLRDSVDTNNDGVKDAIQLTSPVLLNVQSGQRIFPNDIPPCQKGSTLTNGECPPATTAPGDTAYFTGKRWYLTPTGVPIHEQQYKTAIYPVGRYAYTDNNVLDGFVYFYSVTGKDSTGQRDVNGGRGTLAEQEGRRSAVEADGVTPQAEAAASTKPVYVVPNPYRGSAQWDLTPNAADPTGTHVDFFNMPAGQWTLRIFTISGDLVQTLKSDDLQTNGKPQKENEADGQATWNLISRNGQDVVSGIYMFSVESQAGISRGKFVIIR